MIADELVFPGLSQTIRQRSIDFFLVLLGSGVQIQAGCGVEDFLFSLPLGEMVIDRIRNYPRIQDAWKTSCYEFPSTLPLKPATVAKKMVLS